MQTYGNATRTTSLDGDITSRTKRIEGRQGERLLPFFSTAATTGDTARRELKPHTCIEGKINGASASTPTQWKSQSPKSITESTRNKQRTRHKDAITQQSISRPPLHSPETSTGSLALIITLLIVHSLRDPASAARTKHLPSSALKKTTSSKITRTLMHCSKNTESI